MAISWNITGHKKQLAYLEKAFDLGRLSHAYVFFGPSGVGKLSIADKLSEALLCSNRKGGDNCGQCRAMKTGSNPDFIKIDQEEQIRIDQVRQIINVLSLKPYSASCKVAVINRAENLTSEASNSLLKVMEEPKPHTYIILVATNPKSLLPTILSRSQKISFGLVYEQEYLSLLPEELGKRSLDAIKKYAKGRPAMALKLSKSSEVIEALDDYDQKLQDYKSTDLSARLMMAQSLAEKEGHEIKECLKYWMSVLEAELIESKNLTLAENLESIQKSVGLISSNLNSKLVLSSLAIK
jgi:DNA polymerase III delta' subunit